MKIKFSLRQFGAVLNKCKYCVLLAMLLLVFSFCGYIYYRYVYSVLNAPSAQTEFSIITLDEESLNIVVEEIEERKTTLREVQNQYFKSPF